MIFYLKAINSSHKVFDTTLNIPSIATNFYIKRSTLGSLHHQHHNTNNPVSKVCKVFLKGRNWKLQESMMDTVSPHALIVDDVTP